MLGLAEMMSRGDVSEQPGNLRGPGDGTSDSIPALIEGETPAALSVDEFVIPARVVSYIGNGSSEAGAKKLQAFIDKIDSMIKGMDEEQSGLRAAIKEMDK